jgi:hypothetical protein
MKNNITTNPLQTGSGNYQEILRVDHTFNATDSNMGHDAFAN